MAGELPTGHPCHQLSNPSAQLFWCRHCMTGFPDPMQRWRHSKECKEITTQKKYGSFGQSNMPAHHPLASKSDSPTRSPQADSPTPNKKKKAMDLRCYICRKEFVTINEMRDHVKRPCNKPEVKTPSISEDSDDGSPQSEEKVTNQIEALLKAAHAEIMQKKKKSQLKQLYAQTQNGDRLDVYDADDDSCDKSQLTMLDLVNRSKQERDQNDSRHSSAEVDGNIQVFSSAEKMGEAMKVYEFISDTPDSSPYRPNQSPFQHGEASCLLEHSHEQQKLVIQGQSSSENQETTPPQPPFDMTSPQHEGNESEDGSQDSLQKTYVSSMHPQTEDCNKIPKITLKLVSGEKPKTEVWGIGASLPKRIRKRKSKDFFEDAPVKKTKKKEMTLKEMQDKLLKNKCKGKLKITSEMKVGTKLKLKVVSQPNCVTNVEEKENKVSGDENDNTVKGTKVEEPKAVDVNVKGKKKERNARTGKSRRIVGKKNLVVVLTDCLNEKEAAAGSKKQSKSGKSGKKVVNGKQKSVTSKTGSRTKKELQKGKKDNVNNDNGKGKNSKKSTKPVDKKTEKANTKTKQKSFAKPKPVSVREKPVKCKVCDRTFKTRDLLIKHNQMPCRMRTTRTSAQIILRPKKNGSLTLPLTQRQINAAKRRKQIAGKLSILDNSVKKESLPPPQPEKTEKPEKPKKPPRNRKRQSNFITFCITPKEKHPAHEISYDSLSEKDQYFYKLGMYNIVLDRSDSDIKTCDEKSVIDEMKPCEITIDPSAETQSLPSFPSVGSEISPPILEKMSEMQKETENVSNDTHVTSSVYQECLDPPELFTAVSTTKPQSVFKTSPRRTMSLLKNSPYRSPSAKNSPLFSPSRDSPYHSPSAKNSVIDSPAMSKIVSSPCLSPTPSSCSSVSDSEIVLTYNSESILSPTITAGANYNVEKDLSPEHVSDNFIFNDSDNGNTSNDNENDKENKFTHHKPKSKDVESYCDDEEILREMENAKHFDGFLFGLKVLKPSDKLKAISKDVDISALSKQSASEVKYGTNRKLTFTVTRCVQTDDSFLVSLNKTQSCDHNKICEDKTQEKCDKKDGERSRPEGSNKKEFVKNNINSDEDLYDLDFRKVKKVIGQESDKQQKVKPKNQEKTRSVDKVEVGNDFVKDAVVSKKFTESEDRNLFHSIADLISGPEEKTTQESLFESLLPSAKAMFDDIMQMDAMNRQKSAEKVSDPMEKTSITEVEIVLPKGSKVAQLCSDIDWLESADLRPVKTVHPKKEKKGIVEESKTVMASKMTSDFEQSCLQQNPLLNKYVPELSKNSKHFSEVESIISNAQSEVKENPTEIYVYPTKPVVTENESVTVTRPLPAKIDSELNAQSSNSLLDLIAKTMGRIPDSAKEKFEKSVMSLLSSATQQAEVDVKTENKSKPDRKVASPIVIMNNDADSDKFSSDIIVFDDPVMNPIPDRVTNDRVMRPSNFCLPNKSETARAIDESKIQERKSITDTKSSVVVSPWRDIIDQKVQESSTPAFLNGILISTGPQLTCTTSSVGDALFVNSSRQTSDMKLASSNKNSDLKFLSVSSSPSEVLFTNSYSTEVKKVQSKNDLTVHSDSLAMRRKSPKPLSIIPSSPPRTSVLNHGSKDDTVTTMSDQESPTFITSFDFENYVDSLKEETFFSTHPLSPLQPVSLTLSSSNEECKNSEKKLKPKDFSPVKSLPVTSVVTSQSKDNYLKPLAIDCNQSAVTEDSICDISPPLDGPVPNISPMDLAKVATAKMTNPLILKSQGLDQGLLQLSRNEPMHSPNLFLPQGNPQFYVSPKDFTSVEQRKMSPSVSNSRNIIQTSPIVSKSWSATSPTVTKSWSSSSPVSQGWSPTSPVMAKSWSATSPVLNKSWSSASPVSSRKWSPSNPVVTKSLTPFSDNSSPVQVVDVHLNSFNPSPQGKANVRDRRYSDQTGMDLRQNVIVSPPSTSKMCTSTNKDAERKFSKQKHVNNVGILRNNKAQDRRASVPEKFNLSSANQQLSLPSYIHPTTMTTCSASSNSYHSSSVDQPIDILDLVDKSWEDQLNLMQNNQPKPSFSINSRDPFSGSHINKASAIPHHNIEQTRGKNVDKVIKHEFNEDGFCSRNSRLSDPDNKFPQMHPKFAHHKQLQMKSLNKVPYENSKSSLMNTKPQNVNISRGQAPRQGYTLPPNRIPREPPLTKPQCEHASKKVSNFSSQGKTLSRSQGDHSSSKPQFEHNSRSQGNIMARNQSEQFSDKRNLELFQQVPQQQTLFNSHLSPENISQIMHSSGVHRSQSFDQAQHRNTRYVSMADKSVISSPPVSFKPQQDSPKDRIFNLQPASLQGQGSSQVRVGLQGQVVPPQRLSQPGLRMPFGPQGHADSHLPIHRQMSAPSNLNIKPQNVVPEYEDVSSPEEVEVYPTKPKNKDPPPYHMPGETMSIHSVAKGHSSHPGIPDNFDLKSSLTPKVQYPGQPGMLNPGVRGFLEQRPPPMNFFPPGTQHAVRKPFDPSLSFSEFCPSNISDSILDNL